MSIIAAILFDSSHNVSIMTHFISEDTADEEGKMWNKLKSMLSQSLAKEQQKRSISKDSHTARWKIPVKGFCLKKWHISSYTILCVHVGFMWKDLLAMLLTIDSHYLYNDLFEAWNFSMT